MSKLKGIRCDVCGRTIEEKNYYKFKYRWYDKWEGITCVEIKHMCCECYLDFLRFAAEKNNK